MRNCKYCGKEYPDEATVCELDGSPLVEPNVATPSPVTKPEQSSGGTPPLLQPSHSPLSSKTENILGVIVGAIGVLILVVGTLSLANFGARTVNAGCLAIGLVMLILGIRMAQKKDRAYFFTMRSTAVFALVVCTSCSLYFLFKGEDSHCDFSTSSGLFRERGISAYTYYFIWPQSKRDYVSKIEEAFNKYLSSPECPSLVRDSFFGHSDYIYPLDHYHFEVMSDKEQLNIIIAILFQAVTILVITYSLWRIVSTRKDGQLTKNNVPSIIR